MEEQHQESSNNLEKVYVTEKQELDLFGINPELVYNTIVNVKAWIFRNNFHAGVVDIEATDEEFYKHHSLHESLHTIDLLDVNGFSESPVQRKELGKTFMINHATLGGLLVSGDETLKNQLVAKWTVARKAMIAAKFPTLMLECRVVQPINSIVSMDRHYGKQSISVVKIKNKETNK